MGLGRFLAGVATGGLSEVARKAAPALGFGPNSFTPKETYNPYETNKKALGGFEDYIAGQKRYDPNSGQQAQARQQMEGLGQSYQDIIAGKGPSVAQQQLQMGQEQSLKNAAALGASQAARGAGYGGLARGLAQQTALSGQDVAQKSAMLRAQEQQAAMGQYGQLLGQTRGQDLQSQQMAMQEQQQYNETKQKLLAMGMNIEQAEAAAQQAAEQARLQAQAAKRGMVGKLLGGVARIGAAVATGGGSEAVRGVGGLVGAAGGQMTGGAPAPVAQSYGGSYIA